MTRGERQGRANNESSINVAIRLRPINDRESLSLSSSSDERRQRRRDDKPAWRVIPETNSIEQVIFARPSSLEDDSSSSSSSSMAPPSFLCALRTPPNLDSDITGTTL
mmetsp:Transcript_16217/g.20208  ORF Transcript_16217/g.20208 Transcript_16217/m.20208 type:complete len:108 (+) Transcript_16217:19-342(+)